MKLKKGVWCFADFKLVEIQKTYGFGAETLEPMSFGAVRSGTSNENCFPISMHVAKMSALVQCVSDRLHETCRKRNPYIFNFPDINRKLVSMWVKLCKMNPERDAKEFETSVKELEKFSNSILHHMFSKKRKTSRKQRVIFGINLYNHNIQKQISK